MATELVGIELNLIGEDGVYSDLRKLDALIKSFRGRHRIEIDLGRTKQRMLEVSSEIKKLKAEMRDTARGSDEYKSLQGKLKTLEQEYSKLTTRAREYNMALKQHRSFASVFSSIYQRVKSVGSALVSAGNALRTFSSPFRSLMRGTILGAGYKLLGMATSGLSGATERYDTFKTYEKALNALGYDASQKFVLSTKEEMTALENLNEAVLGLPTGLDEIVSAQKRYLAASGDIITATKAAIAANNVFLAQGSDARDQLRGSRQIRNLLAGGEMTTARWQSILESMPLAVNAVGEELGYASNEMDKFRQQLLDGKIDAEAFLEAFLTVGTKGRIRDATEEMKHTFSAVTANIGNAFKRMGENVLKTLDEVLLKYTGKDTIDVLLELKGGIDAFSKGVQDWIRSNPDVLINLLDTIKKVDVGSFFRGIADGLVNVIDLTSKFINLFGGANLSGVGKWMVYANMLAPVLTVVGGLLKGVGALSLAFAGASVYRLIQMVSAGKVGGGLIGKIIQMFAGKNAGKTLAEAPTMMNSMKGVVAGLSGIMKVAGTIAIASGTAWFATKAFKETLKNIDEFIEISKVIDWKGGAGALAGMVGFFTIMAELGYVVGHNFAGEAVSVIIGETLIGTITAIASGFAALDLYLLKKGAEQLDSAMDAITSSIDKMSAIGSIPDGVVSKIGNTIDVYNQIIELFNGKTGSIADRGVVSQGLLSLSAGKAKTIDNIKTIIDSIVAVADSVNELNLAEIHTEHIGRVKDALNTVIQTIGEVFEDVPLVFEQAAGAGISSDISTTLQSMKDVFGTLLGKGGVISQISKFANDKNMASAMVGIPMMESRLEQVFSALGTVAEYFDRNNSLRPGKANEMNESMNAVNSALTTMQNVLKSMRKIGKSKKFNATVFTEAANRITSVLDQLQTALDASKVEHIKTQAEAFVSAVEGLLDSISNISGSAGKLTIEIHVSDKIYGLETVLRHIRYINTSVRSAINGIQTSYNKNIHVNLTTTTGRTRMYDSTVSGNHMSVGGRVSRHGVIYRAKGGDVFRPRGTDKIPAMLTEGEYVHRREAVNTFGIDFMRKVNSLDIRGAMSALLSRANNTTGIGRQNVVNNTVNNNQRVTQNINTNNPQFASMRIGRYAGAL